MNRNASLDQVPDDGALLPLRGYSELPGAHFEALFELTGAGVIVMDAQTCALNKVNPAFCRMTGHSSRDLTGMTILEVIHPDERKKFTETWQKRLDQPDSKLDIETRIAGRDGKATSVTMKSKIVPDDQGGPPHSVTVIRDKSEPGHSTAEMEEERQFFEEAFFEASEHERYRIGQDLHDHLCQHLLGAAFAAKALGGALDREGSKNAPELHTLANIINDAVVQVREISRGLHPVEPTPAGLMSALEELASRTNNSTSCRLTCDRPILVNNERTALHVYRIAQEMVANAIQRTEAREIDISLTENSSDIFMRIIEDGQTKSDLTTNPDGTAARTLFYRARAIHGKLSINHRSEKGTSITCIFPKQS